MVLYKIKLKSIKKESICDTLKTQHKHYIASQKPAKEDASLAVSEKWPQRQKYAEEEGTRATESTTPLPKQAGLHVVNGECTAFIQFTESSGHSKLS